MGWRLLSWRGTWWDPENQESSFSMRFPRMRLLGFRYTGPKEAKEAREAERNQILYIYGR